VYTTFLNQWKAAGYLHMMNHYNDIMTPQVQYGLWGALNSVMSSSSPKYSALTGFISANACWWSNCNAGTSTTGTTATPPPIPTGLTGTATSATQSNLSWAASTSATGYSVFRNGVSRGTTSSTSYADSGLSAGGTYSYTVAASNAVGSSAQS